MSLFDPINQESVIQKRWLDANAFDAPYANEISCNDKLFYMLVMLPYPSGRIHMGHVRNYTLGDVVARFRRMCGYKVLNPIGWDAFGLPAENAAIQNGTHPSIWTKNNIIEMKKQIQRLGISYDWDREIVTFDPDYYKWNQWFFLQMWRRGDVFRALRNVNWCEKLGTVLANEQVIDGKDERTGYSVVQKPMEQYFFAITRYAELLLSGHDQLDWPESVKSMQKYWIGKSVGVKIIFQLSNKEQLQVFTTRLDTLYGVTFLALSVEHKLVQDLAKIDGSLWNFCNKFSLQSREDRLFSDEKFGYLLNIKAVHPLTEEYIPVYATNYILTDYGTGAIMGVPAHDERDMEFAKKYNIKIHEVIKSSIDGDVLVNSGEFTGMSVIDAKKNMMCRFGNKIEEAIVFKLKDWGLSRQRYWGTPIPIVHCKVCGIVPEKEDNLPIILPNDIAFSGIGISPLATSEEFLQCRCPNCGGIGRRETDTMDTFVDSSWYWLRYLDPKNNNEPFKRQEADVWCPVDLYIGGIEHANMHLIYARYFYKVLYDLKLVPNNEPFKKLICQGMVLKNGIKMSKSKGNIVDPDDVIARYGADALRLFITFAAPIEKEINWVGFDGIEGTSRFLKRIVKVVDEHVKNNNSKMNNFALTRECLDVHGQYILSKVYQTLKKVTDDLSVKYQFNTVVSSLMELLNAIANTPKDMIFRSVVLQKVLEIFVLMLSPIAPHIAEQLWVTLGGIGLCMHAPWPEIDDEWTSSDQITLVLQVNGKTRGKVLIPRNYTIDERREVALGYNAVINLLKNKIISKIVVSKDMKLVNIVTN